jgi:ABC-2 type transport system permease protein
MSISIFKNTLKRNLKLLLIFFVVLCFYQTVIITLINPSDMEKIKELYGTMGNLLPAFGISIVAMTSPLSYTASTFFGTLVMAFTMVFYVIQGNNLIAKQVDDTSIVYVLSAPVTRTKLIITQGVYLIFSLAVLFLGILVTGSVVLSGFGNFNFNAYLNLVMLTFLLCTAIAMLSFFLSVAFCDTKLGTALGTGVPIALLIISMLGGAGGDSTKWLKQVSPFGWIDSVKIVNGDISTWWMYIVFTGIIVVLFIASIAVFNKKRLPI